jgi:hypothetical protein
MSEAVADHGGAVELDSKVAGGLAKQQGAGLAALAAALVRAVIDRVDASARPLHLGSHPVVDLRQVGLRHPPSRDPELVRCHHHGHAKTAEEAEPVEGRRRELELRPRGHVLASRALTLLTPSRSRKTALR